MRKRFLSFLLTFALVLTSFPTLILADNVTSAGTPATTGIGGLDVSVKNGVATVTVHLSYSDDDGTYTYAEKSKNNLYLTVVPDYIYDSTISNMAYNTVTSNKAAESGDDQKYYIAHQWSWDGTAGALTFDAGDTVAADGSTVTRSFDLHAAAGNTVDPPEETLTYVAVLYSANMNLSSDTNYYMADFAVDTDGNKVLDPATVTITGAETTYDGTAHGATTISYADASGNAITDTGKFTVKYGGSTDLPKNVGTYAITVESSDYEIKYATGSDDEVVKINPAPLSVTISGSVTPNGKQYDGNTNVSFAAAPAVADVVSTSSTLYESKTLADLIDVKYNWKTSAVGETVVQATASLKDGVTNYSMTTVGPTDLTNGDTTKGKISAREVTLTYPTITKVYDGNNTVTGLTADKITVNNKVDGEDVKVTFTSAAYADATVGTNKDITVTGLALDGTNKGNYTLAADQDKTKGDITNAGAITATLTNAEKTYGTARDTLTVSDFTFADGSGNSVTGVTGLEFSCDGLAADANVGEYTINVTNKGAYTDVTVTNKLTVKQAPTITEVTAKTGLKYKGTAYGNSELIESVKVYKTADGTTKGDEITAFTPDYGTLLNAIVVNDYTVNVTATPTDTNYAASTGSATAKIEKATVTGIKIVTQPKLTYDVDDMFDNSAAKISAVCDSGYEADVTAATTNDAPTAALTVDDSGKKITYSYNATPDADNINAPASAVTAESDELTVNDLPENDKVPAVSAAAPTTLGGNGTITISKKAEDTDIADNAVVEYQNKGGDWTSATKATLVDGTISVDAAPGDYEVRYADSDTAKASTTKFASVTVPNVATYELVARKMAEDGHGTYGYIVNGTDTKVGTDADKKTTGLLKDTEVTVYADPESTSYSKISVDVSYDYVDENGNNKTASVPVTEVDDAAHEYSCMFKMPENDVEISVTFKKKSSGGGGGGTTVYTVKYNAGTNGTITSGEASEKVASGASPAAVPEITAKDGYVFKGWSLDGTTVVEPTEQKITKATTFNALYEEVGAATPTPAPSTGNEPVADTDAHKQYISGYEDGTFRADDTITRAEAATIFARALTDYDENSSYANVYPDVDSSEWFANYVAYLSNTGIITGYEDGTFRPQQNITRQEFATMLSKLGTVLEAGDMPFTDVSDANWGIDYIYTAYANGWVAGYEDNTFRPDNNITRAEAVRMVNVYLGRGTDAAGLEGVDYTVFPDVDSSHWAYYEIIEAANDHTFEKDTMPENWVE